MVITDFKMPGMDGAARGFHALLNKPFSLAVLQAALAENDLSRAENFSQAFIAA